MPEPLVEKKSGEEKTLLLSKPDQADNGPKMGSERWHALLAAVGPKIAGQKEGEAKGYLSPKDSLKVKTLTKETLGELTFQRGLHPDTRKNYSSIYCELPWSKCYNELISCQDQSSQNANPGNELSCFICGICYSACTCPCLTFLSLCCGLAGSCKDFYNLSKKGFVIDDSKGIELGLPANFFTKTLTRVVSSSPERQIMDSAVRVRPVTLTL